VKPPGELRKAGDCEIKVFEEAEEDKIDSYGDDQEEFAAAWIGRAKHGKASKVADRSGEGHESAEFVIPGAVKNVAGDGEPNVAVLFCAEAPETEVDDWQEKKKKDEAVEEHVLASAIAGPGRLG